MAARLSASLSALATAGNRLVRVSTSEPVLLRGVNRSGMEYSEPDEDGFASAAGISRYEIRFIVQQWRANIIRLPINQDWVLNGRGRFSGEDYCRDLDQIISWAACYGAYTLLDLQWIDADNPFGANRQFVPPLPNPKTPEMWRLLAARYREEPAVLFDIFNEPHDRMPDDPYPLWRPDGTTHPPQHRIVSPAEWHPWVYHLVNVIRAEHPDALIFVSGTNWGYDLRGFPLPIPNLVYSTHIYRNKGSAWDTSFGFLTGTVPVFAGEWGGVAEDLDWGIRLVKYLREREMGWTAWSWADKPQLVNRYQTTPFGALVRDSV